MSVSKVGQCLVLNPAERRQILGLMQGTQPTTEQSQMAVYELNIQQEARPKGKASLVKWVEATFKIIYLKGGTVFLFL
jgi:hypothetical protein